MPSILDTISDTAIALGTGQNPAALREDAYNSGRLHSAQTEGALAQARQRRAQAMLDERTLAEREQLRERMAANGADPSIVDTMLAGYNPDQYQQAALGAQEQGFRGTLADPTADPAAQFAAGQGVQGKVMPRYYQPATGMMADMVAPATPPTVTPIGESQSKANEALGVQRQASAGAADALGDLRGRTDPNAAKTPAPGAAPKPLPVGALKMIDEATQAIGAADSADALVQEANGILEGGQVDLGLANNLWNRGRNLIGESTPESLAYATVSQTLEKLRNTYLLLAKGVQTEGDATRAWNSEVGESAQYDNELAKQQIQRAMDLIAMGRTLQQRRIQNVQSNYGASAPGAAAPAQTRAPPQAEAYLRAHPELKADFQAKYGYLPEGI